MIIRITLEFTWIQVSRDTGDMELVNSLDRGNISLVFTKNVGL